MRLGTFKTLAGCQPQVVLLLCREVFGGIEIVFVGSAEADAFIAQEAQSLRKSGCPYVRILACPASGHLVPQPSYS